MIKPEYPGDESPESLKTYQMQLDEYLNNIADLTVLGTTASGSYVQSELQAVIDKLDAHIKRSGTDES